MSRRAALPGANELFRATSSSAALAEGPAAVETALRDGAAIVWPPPAAPPWPRRQVPIS